MFYSIVLVLPYISEAAIGIHMSPLLEAPFPPPTPSHPSWLSQSTKFEQQISTGYLILYMVMYMFQCSCLNLSPPLLPLTVSTRLFAMEPYFCDI